MAANDLEILESFTRQRPDGTDLVLEVAVISWRAGPHTPETNFVEVCRMAIHTAPEEISRARRALLDRRRFFKVCSMCHERNPVGWMHDAKVCQGCAERHLGVVH